MTPPQIRRRAAFALSLAAALAWSAYCGLRDRRDRLWLAETAHRVVAEAGARTPRERAVAVRDFLRRTVTFRGAPHDGRPFLRATARETIESGRGYCGESTRAFVLLAGELGLRAQRVNLHGRVNHVVAEVQLGPGHSVLFDPQANPEVNPYFDARDTTADELIVRPGVPFRSYSNLNLRRVPVLGAVVLRIRTEEGWLTRTLERPWLIHAYGALALAAAMVVAFAVDRVVIRHYARRLGYTDRRAERPARAAFVPGESDPDRELVGGPGRAAE